MTSFIVLFVMRFLALLIVQRYLSQKLRKNVSLAFIVRWCLMASPPGRCA